MLIPNLLLFYPETQYIRESQRNNQCSWTLANDKGKIDTLNLENICSGEVPTYVVRSEQLDCKFHLTTSKEIIEIVDLESELFGNQLWLSSSYDISKDKFGDIEFTLKRD